MKPGARIAAAIEILDTILTRHQPVALALADWGKRHRFAGSGDRNAIGGIVYDALRRRASIAWAMSSETPRALALGACGAALALTPNEITASCDGEAHAPAPLSEAEREGLTRSAEFAPPHVRADVPAWLWPRFEAAFGARAVDEGRALAERAPTDVRVNTLKSTPEKVLKALADFGALSGAWSPLCVRIPAAQGPRRTPNIEAEAAFQAGWFEIQDQGSQIAAALAGAAPRLQVLDMCAGGGGKTLAMAAAMQNTGQIYAYDEDRLRLKPIFQRLKRAGARNVQVLRGGDERALMALGARFDLVLIDAPCTGTGVWRRRPDAKWRVKEQAIVERNSEQLAILRRARELVRPGGRLAYVTCSVLPEENHELIERFLNDAAEFTIKPFADVWRAQLGTDPPESADGRTDMLQLTPASHGTDGFFIAVLERAK